MKRIVSILLVLAAIAGLCACGESEYKRGNTETVLELGSHSVPEELYRYFLLHTMDEMIAKDKDCFSGKDAASAYDELDERVIASLKDYYSVLDLADEMGVSLTDKEEQSAKDNIKSLKAECKDEEEYEKALKAQYLSEYVAYKLGYNEVLYGAIYKTAAETGKYFAVDGTTVEEYAKQNFLFCRQFVIKSEDPVKDTDAQVKAEAIQARLLAGEDAAKILKDYEEDEKVVGGYYCFATTEDFAALDEDAVAAMKPGDVSEIRMDGQGFHIIIRLEADEEYLEENLMQGVFESYCMNQLVQMQNKIKNEYTVEYVNKKSPEDYR